MIFRRETSFSGSNRLQPHSKEWKIVITSCNGASKEWEKEKKPIWRQKRNLSNDQTWLDASKSKWPPPPHIRRRTKKDTLDQVEKGRKVKKKRWTKSKKATRWAESWLTVCLAIKTLQPRWSNSLRKDVQSRKAFVQKGDNGQYGRLCATVWISSDRSNNRVLAERGGLPKILQRQKSSRQCGQTREEDSVEQNRVKNYESLIEIQYFINMKTITLKQISKNPNSDRQFALW